jgi:PAN domain
MNKKLINKLAGCTLITASIALLTSIHIPASAFPRFVVDFNTDRMGNDYRKFDSNNMESCLRACASESNCKAFTYVPAYAQPEAANPVGICWLKNARPKATNNPSGMISGVKA